MIRAGIIGCGDVARRAYVPGIQQLSDLITVTRTFDTVDERASDIAAMFPGATAHTDMGRFLDRDADPAPAGGMDLVFNLTPAPLHRRITGQVLEAGYHVMSEKPIAATVQEAEELVRIAETQGRALLAAPAMMVTARFMWIKALLESGELGRPVSIKGQIGGMGPAAWSEYFGDPRVFYQQGVGPLIDTGVYQLHAMTGLLGPAKRVHAMGGIVIPRRTIEIPRFGGEVIDVTTPDQLSINIDFGTNTFGHLYSSFAVPASKAPMFEIFCERGTIGIPHRFWYDGNGPTEVFRMETHAWDEVAQPEPLRTPGILESGILHAVRHIEEGEPLVLTAAHATHVLEIMNAALASIETGDPQEIASTF